MAGRCDLVLQLADGRTILRVRRPAAQSKTAASSYLVILGCAWSDDEMETYPPVLEADIALVSADQALAALDTRIAADQVTVFLALGGG